MKVRLLQIDVPSTPVGSATHPGGGFLRPVVISQSEPQPVIGGRCIIRVSLKSSVLATLRPTLRLSFRRRQDTPNRPAWPPAIGEARRGRACLSYSFSSRPALVRGWQRRDSNLSRGRIKFARYALAWFPAGPITFQAARLHPAVPAALADRPPSGPDWLHEIKVHGYRVIARKDGDRVSLFDQS